MKRIFLKPAAIVLSYLLFGASLFGQRQMENLDRGVIAVNKGNGQVYIGWRLLGLDPAGISFNLYRSVGGGTATKLNASPITTTTDFVNTGVDISKSNAYYVKPVIGGVEQASSETYTLRANAAAQQYLSIPLRDGGAVYAQASVGDVDGDGEYEIIVKWSKSAGVDPGSHTKGTATVYIDAYKLNGTFLWRIDLGWNLEPGSDFTPMEVYDIDGDGKAEIITKTAEGTIDGTGVKIGDTNGDGITDYRNSDGRVISGPEFISIFRGTDGKEIARTNWIARGSISDWGDSSGNRSCRNQMGIAYLDGVRPSIVMSRGVYAYQIVETWNYRNGALSKAWSWNNGGKGQSTEWQSNAQCFRMGDVDGDGKDEIVKGQLVIDHDGSTLWTLGLTKGHGDYTHVGVFDPSRSGLQIFKILEAGQANGVAMLDAKTGKIIWGKTTTGDAGRGYCANIDPRYKGAQCWAGQTNNNLLNYDGSVICTTGPQATSCFAPIWWDNGLCRALTDEHSGTDGVHIKKWDYANCATTTYLTAGTGTRTIEFIGDLFGDWREELVIYQPNEIQIYTTTIPAINRIYTLMHNPLYKLNVGQWAQRNASPSHPDFYLGTGMSIPPTPNITYVSGPLNTTVTIQENTAGFCSVDGTIDSNNAGFTGTGFANANNALDAGITWSVNIPSTSTFTLKWKYANGTTTDRPGRIKVDGTTVVANLGLPGTGAWTTWVETPGTNVSLAAGNRLIRLEATTANGLSNIDYFSITGVSSTPVSCTGLKSANETISEINSLSISPNPVVNPYVELRLRMANRCEIKILIYDYLGKLVYQKKMGVTEAGEVTQILDLGSIPKGIYMVKVQTINGNATTKLIRL